MGVTQKFLLTGGGRIICLRCTAKSVRSGEQCAKPAMKSSHAQKCTHHGGRSTGPKTAQGKQRCIAAHQIDGKNTRKMRAEHSKKSALISMLEDCLHVLGMTDAKRNRGRKSDEYRQLTTLDEVCNFLLHQNMK